MFKKYYNEEVSLVRLCYVAIITHKAKTQGNIQGKVKSKWSIVKTLILECYINKCYVLGTPTEIF